MNTKDVDDMLLFVWRLGHVTCLHLPTTLLSKYQHKDDEHRRGYCDTYVAIIHLLRIANRMA